MKQIENAKIVHMTVKAAAVWINGGPHKGGKGVWLPLSQIHNDSTALDEEEGTIIIPEWLAKQKGL